jgi:hypothetical protein
LNIVEQASTKGYWGLGRDMMKDSLHVRSKTAFNHDVETMRRGRVVVRFARSNYGDIVGRFNRIKIGAPSRKRKVLSKRSRARRSSGEINSKWDVTHAPMSPDDGKSSKIPISRNAPTGGPLTVEVVRSK